MKYGISLIAMLAMAFIAPAQGAQWTIGSSSGAPGASVPITVQISGDGETTDGVLTLIFDESRLSLPVASGSIPGAAVGSGVSCIRSASNQVRVLRLGVSSPFANTLTTLCNIPFAILNPAPRGSAAIVVQSVEC